MLINYWYFEDFGFLEDGFWLAQVFRFVFSLSLPPIFFFLSLCLSVFSLFLAFSRFFSLFLAFSRFFSFLEWIDLCLNGVLTTVSIYEVCSRMMNCLRRLSI